MDFSLHEVTKIYPYTPSFPAEGHPGSLLLLPVSGKLANQGLKNKLNCLMTLGCEVKGHEWRAESWNCAKGWKPGAIKMGD